MHTYIYIDRESRTWPYLCRGLRRGLSPSGSPGSLGPGSAWGLCPPAAWSGGLRQSHSGRPPCAAWPGPAPSRTPTTGSAHARVNREPHPLQVSQMFLLML